MVVALAAVLLGALPGVAGARRDDLPTEARAPASGATIADATHGITVKFTCPRYHPTSYDDVIPAPADGYHVILARSATVGEDRLLAVADLVEVRDAVEVDGEPGMCTAAPDAAENGLLPREPGGYWWQPYRDCATYLCAGGVEAGDPSAVTVTRTVCSTDRASLSRARRDRATAVAALKRRRTTARRARVARLDARIAQLKSRLRVVYRCAGG
jgi:hypothetical protein